MVFQHYALFPHLDVAANIAYGLKQRSPRPAATELARRVDAMLELVRLAGPRRAARVGAVGRPAAAGGAGTGTGQPADRAPARRAPGGAGPQAAPRDADRAAEPAARGRHHLRPGHPRPGGGAVDERHDLHHAPRAGSCSRARPAASTTRRPAPGSPTSSASRTSWPARSRRSRRRHRRDRRRCRADARPAGGGGSPLRAGERRRAGGAAGDGARWRRRGPASRAAGAEPDLPGRAHRVSRAHAGSGRSAGAGAARGRGGQRLRARRRGGAGTGRTVAALALADDRQAQ